MFSSETKWNLGCIHFSSVYKKNARHFCHVKSNSKLSNYIQKSPLSQANSSSASQEIPHISWNPKVHYSVHKSPPLVPVPTQMNAAFSTPSYFLTFHFKYVFLCNIIHHFRDKYLTILLHLYCDMFRFLQNN